MERTHDEDISREAIFGKGIGSEKRLFVLGSLYPGTLPKRLRKKLLAKGELILVDYQYEFGENQRWEKSYDR